MNGRYEIREGQGSLFVNEGREGEQPDYRGNVRIGGVLYRLAGWKRTAQSGKRWLALKIEAEPPGQQPLRRAAQPAPMQRPATTARAAADEFDDDIPF